MNIGELSRQTGVSTKTVRYYETIGLVPPPERADNGYRIYQPDAVERLLFIRDAQASGLSLTEIGAIDDSQFARAFARSRALGKGMSKRRLQRELSRRGVDRKMADAAIADVLEEESVDERALLEAAARKKLAVLRGQEPDAVRKRLYGYLARRGYDSADIAAVLRTIMADYRP